MIPVRPEAVRCAAWAHDNEVDPIGTAGAYDGYLLLDLALPWPRDIGEVVGGAPAVERAAELGIRVQATVPSDAAVGRVVLYRRPPGDPFRSMVRHAVTVPLHDVRDAANTLLLEDRPPASDGFDVLVCTHGRRDACCGTTGTRLASDLSSWSGGSLPVSRTSHTGGHRFAPTFIALPEATAWAFADVDLVDRVVNRRGDAADVVDRYRGCAGLRHPRHQALEREVLREVGWPLLDRSRHATDLDGDRIALVAERADGGHDRWEAEVTRGRLMAVPDCGSPIERATKAEPEWLVGDVARRAGPPTPS